jgi:prevent-host-death family protein
MFSVTSDYEVANISELRAKVPDIIRKIAQKKRIIITKNNEPSMVILNYKEYQELLEAIEQYEDNYLGRQAAERLETFDHKTAVTLKDVEEMVGL